MKICYLLKSRILSFLIRLKFPSITHISSSELAAWLEDDLRCSPVLLDARTAEEYAISHLQQARLSPPNLLQWRDRMELSRQTPIVTYCSVGYRSAILARRLQDHGFEQVFNLEGSLFAWFRENRPVYQDGQPVRQIHPYNFFWSLWL